MEEEKKKKKEVCFVKSERVYEQRYFFSSMLLSYFSVFGCVIQSNRIQPFHTTFCITVCFETCIS